MIDDALCPACGFPLDYQPWKGENASHEICPCCGIHFGYDDAARGDAAARPILYLGWRNCWRAHGCRWWSKNPPPANWDSKTQLESLEAYLRVASRSRSPMSDSMISILRNTCIYISIVFGPWIPFLVIGLLVKSNAIRCENSSDCWLIYWIEENLGLLLAILYISVGVVLMAMRKWAYGLISCACICLIFLWRIVFVMPC